MGLSRDEMETTIRWDDAEKVAHIWTCSPISIRKLDKLVAELPETYKCTKRTEDSAWYEVDAKYIRYGKPASEARREIGRRNAARLHTAKSGDGTEPE